MAVGDRTDPYRGYNFRVEIDNSAVAAFSEVSGLTALPRPEFCIIATERRPPSAAPLAVATASPSLADEM
mgnify:CR=1 FL=1